MIQIVPALPPVPNGVGDYGLSLACALRQDFGVETLFVVVGGDTWDDAEEVEGFRTRRLGARSAQDLGEALCAAAENSAGDSDVLLQLSPYGYSKRGCPFWLLEGLRRWRRKRPGARLITVFHELYVEAAPWRSIFWISLAQRAVVARIARESDIALTNIGRHCRDLERLDPSKRNKIEVLAVPSNVGEPSQPCELSARTKSMVVFGLAASRQRAYTQRIGELRTACERLGITEVHDVGGPTEAVPERIGDAPVTKHGRMEPCELSALLSQSMAGFVNYGPGCMAKSGVFAAYCAHRMLPVMPADGRSEADGIVCGRDYYSVMDMAAAPEPQSIADSAWNWYQGHSLKKHARAFAAKSR